MKIKKYLFLILGCFICSIAYNLFFVPYNIVAGGTSGIAIVINYFLAIDKALLILIMAFVLLITSYILLGRKKTIYSLIGSILFPFFVKLTSLFLLEFPVQIDNVIVSSIFGGIFFGFGLGLIYREGFTTGGTNIINQIVSKYFHFSMGIGMILTEGVIVIIGGFIFGLNNMLYSLISLYLTSIVIDKVIIGISEYKSFYIVTDKIEEVSTYINKRLGHGATLINGEGVYSKKKQNILMTVIPTKDYYKLKNELSSIDKDMFFIVCDSYETSGGF